MAKKSKPTFFAVISDIHGNIDALDAVIADIAHWPVQAILCLGDIVGYGPEPAACVNRVVETCAVTVLGNHDAMLFLDQETGSPTDRKEITVPIALANRQLSQEQKEWIRQLPIAANLDPIALAHGSLHHPESFEYLITADAAKDHFAAQKTFASFVGHTHLPMVWEEHGSQLACYRAPQKPVALDPDRRYAVNVGSVGQPRDQDPRPCYVLYDYQNRLLIHRRVEYDLPRALARFKKSKIPAANAKRLTEGR